MARQVFFLDLKTEDLAAEYAAFHQPGNVPKEVIADIVGAGVGEMQIFLFGDRLVMITEADDGADADARVASAASVQWERRMELFQRPLAGEPKEAKWKPAELIFDLRDHISKEL